MSRRLEPGKPIVDLVKRLTTKVGTVGNLHGNVFEPVPLRTTPLSVGWYHVQGVGSIPRDILVDAANNDRVAGFLPSVDGITDCSRIGTRIEGTSVLLYTGVVTELPDYAPGLTVPIVVNAPACGISLYVNDVPILRGSDRLRTSFLLGPGRSVIQVVLEHGDIQGVTIELPQELVVGELPPAPAAPTWEDDAVRYGFVGEHEEAVGMRLSWGDSSFAGAWRIERTSYRPLGTVVDFTYDDDAETYTFTVNGVHPDVYGPALVGNATLLGPVVGSTVSGSTTDFVVSSTVPSGTWVGEWFYVGHVQSVIAIVEREDALVPEDGVFRYVDTDVRESMPYSYRLSAIHPLHPEVESAWSEPAAALAHDSEPPGPVSDLNVRVINGEIVVDYTAPNDVDYAGTRVFRADGGPGIAIINDFGRPGERDQVRFYPLGSGVYELRTFDWARNVQPPGSGVSFTYSGTAGDTIGTPPEIIIEVTDVSAYSMTLTVTATAPGRTVSLYHYVGTGTAVWTPMANPGTIVLTRASVQAAERVVRVRAVASDGTENEQTFIADWDKLPEMSTVKVMPRYSGTTIVGWRVEGVADDDCRSVVATVSGSLAFAPGQSGTINTTTVKSFVFDLDQAIGTEGYLQIVPYDNPNGTGTSGPPYVDRLSRPPISQAVIREVNLTTVAVTLSAVPETATIYYRRYLANATPQEFMVYSGTFFLTRDQTLDWIVDYYAVVPGVLPEEVNTIRIDADTLAEVYITLAEINPYELTISPTLDEDATFWRLWTRKGAWPTLTGDPPSSPQAVHELSGDYLRYSGPRQSNDVVHYATAGTWYALAVAYDYAGIPGPIASGTITIQGSPSENAALYNVTIELDDDGTDSYHRIKWQHTEEIDNDYSGDQRFVVDVAYSLDGEPYKNIVTDRHASLDSESGDSPWNMINDVNDPFRLRQGSVIENTMNAGPGLRHVSLGGGGTGFGSVGWHSFIYKVTLKDKLTGQVLGTYTAETIGPYIDMGGGNNPGFGFE